MEPARETTDFWVLSQSINGGNTVNFTYDNNGLVTGSGIGNPKAQSQQKHLASGCG